LHEFGSSSSSSSSRYGGGPYHKQRERHDGARDRALNELGWKVLRVSAQLVFSHLDGVVDSIAQTARRLALAGA
jgi:very-short-patch-repair endonuclease